MSIEKKVSWRKGKVVWRSRLYIAPEAMAAIEKQAKREDRDKAYLMSKALEKVFGKSEGDGAGIQWQKSANQ